MRISRLAAESGVSVGTIKFYLREDVLHDGVRTSATQAAYDDSHLRRLGLIGALTGPAGLSIAQTRAVITALESGGTTLHDLLGHVHHVTGPTIDPAQDLTAAQALMARLGWRVSADDVPTVGAVARALDGMAAAGFTLTGPELDDLAERMGGIAAADVARVPTDSSEAAARYAALGTVLLEPLLLALRRLAQQHASLERFGDRPAE